MACLIANKEKLSSYHAPLVERKYIRETAFTANFLRESKDSITGQPLCLTSLFTFSTHTAFLHLRQQVPEALPPWSLLSVSSMVGCLSLLFEIRKIKQSNSVDAGCVVFVL